MSALDTTCPARIARYSSSRYSIACSSTGRPSTRTACEALSTSSGPARNTGAVRPWLRRISARQRASSSVSSKGFVR